MAGFPIGASAIGSGFETPTLFIDYARLFSGSAVFDKNMTAAARFDPSALSVAVFDKNFASESAFDAHAARTGTFDKNISISTINNI